MLIEIHQPTPAEIRAYEAKAHALRAAAMRDMIMGLSANVKSLFHRAVDVFSRPAHA